MRARRAGFSLVELLFAAGLLSAVLTAIQQTFVMGRRVAAAAEAGLDHDRKVLVALRRLEKALGSASPLMQPDEEADFRGDEEDLRLTAYRYPGPRAGEGGMAKLHLGQDGDGVFLEVLVPSFGPPVGLAAGDPVRVERFPELKGFKAEYFDGEDWEKDWNIRRTLRLPAAVRLALEVERPTPTGGRREAIELVVPYRAQRDVAIR